MNQRPIPPDKAREAADDRPTTIPAHRSREPLLFLTLLFTAYVAICIVYVEKMDRWRLDQAALENAQRYTDVVSAFRTTYTAHVVPKAKNFGMEISHDPTHVESIPLPATMSILIGEQLAREERGLQVSLYSPFPFPWRTQSGLKDEFAKETWQVLSENQDTRHFQFIDSAGERMIRYAVADVMRPECVNCHNTHPKSPKRDWVSGQVRGVLEVRFPVARSQGSNMHLFGGLFLLLSGCAAFFVVAVILGRLQDQVEAKRLSEVRLAAALLEIQQSKQRVIEEKLEVVGHVAAGIAHDFNNVLMIVLGYTDMALTRLAPDSKISTYLEKSRIATRRARALANKLPIVHSHQTFHPIAINLLQTVEKTVDLIQPLLSGSETNLEIIAPEESVAILAEPDQIERLLINLVINAVDATGEGGTVSISVERQQQKDDSWWGVLSILDTGPGIEKDVMPRLFEPFFTTKKSGSTAGLGLFTVRQIVDQHGGSIEVESVRGEGSMFRIFLPLSKTEAREYDSDWTRRENSELNRTTHILVVDDDQDVRQFLSTALLQSGYQVTLSTDGEEAMEQFGERADDFDLIVTDIRMPKMDGREFAGAVRELRPNQPLLFISGYEEDVRRLEGDFSGETPFLKKPFGPTDLIDSVKTILASK